jgi:hypothetical protein
MDVWTFRLVTLLLGTISLFCLGSIVFLHSKGIQPPEVFSTVAGTAAGVLGGLLINPRQGSVTNSNQYPTRLPNEKE